MASDEDLKLSDMLRYYMRDAQAAKVSQWSRGVQGGRVGRTEPVCGWPAAGPAVPETAGPGGL